MLQFIEELPEDTLGVKAIGLVSHADYQTILIPAIESHLTKKPLKLLYIIGSEFTGYETRALIDDTALGLKHWREFPFIALVTDIDWIKNAVHLFTPFFPGEVRLFSVSEQENAKEWISNAQLPAQA